MAKLVFLGRLADRAGASEREVPAGVLADILAGLEPALAVDLLCDRVRLALNGRLVSDPASIMLGEDDELAFLPPVSGG